MKKYTVEEILKAAEIGEVSMIDAKHVVSLLDEAKHILKVEFDCHNCKHSFSNPFDQYYCQKTDENGKGYDLENDEDCGGVYYER
jgi:Zn finger protein HypA/HybF involved in hydrogenase expression